MTWIVEVILGGSLHASLVVGGGINVLCLTHNSWIAQARLVIVAEVVGRLHGLCVIGDLATHLWSRAMTRWLLLVLDNLGLLLHVLVVLVLAWLLLAMVELLNGVIRLSDTWRHGNLRLEFIQGTIFVVLMLDLGYLWRLDYLFSRL